jgi:NAD(P)-dependent dehydrogenase (short-subunit alcohol dehydrogenase family)
LGDKLNRWREEGHSVVVIGNRSAHFATAFRREFGLGVPVLVDPEKAAYRAADLRRGVSTMLSPRLVTNALRAMKRGAKQTSTQGDPWQLGGVFVIGPGDEMRFVFRSGTAGDHASAVDIEAALDGHVPGRASSGASSIGSMVDSMRSVLDVSPVLSFDRLGFRRHALGFDPAALDVDLAGRRCVITGGNSGIGYATANALAALGAEVVLLCRNRARGEEAVRSIRQSTGNDEVSLTLLDITDLSAVDTVAGALAARPVDVLVHNAGVLPDSRVETREGLELGFATHVAGPHRLTRGLRPALEAAGAARVVWVSSGGMLTCRLNVRDPQWRSRPYDGVRAYAETKRAQVVLSELWAEELRSAGVRVNAMHPGWADTPAVRKSLPRFHRAAEAILRTPEEGADSVVWLAASKATGEETGRFFFDRSAVRTHWIPWTRESVGDRRALWNLCESIAFERCPTFDVQRGRTYPEDPRA